MAGTARSVRLCYGSRDERRFCAIACATSINENDAGSVFKARKCRADRIGDAGGDLGVNRDAGSGGDGMNSFGARLGHPGRLVLGL
jgi:hypothetical protein